MFLVQECPKNPEDFTVFLTGINQIIVGKSTDNSVQKYNSPEPPIVENLSKGQIEVIKKENSIITCLEFSKDNQYIVITSENKQLVVYNTNYKTIKNTILTRVASKVCFTPSNDILVADRTGDVYLYKLNEDNEPTLLLGHLSVILDMLITDCGKYIITCDRDEKIRVSCFPNAYNIVSYCLGHEEFVTSMEIIKGRNILVSASGDGTIRFWNYLEGRQAQIINTNGLVDENSLKNFSKQMDTEKVDVTTIPVTNVQISAINSRTIVATTLYSIAKIFLYNIDENTLKYNYLGHIDVEEPTFFYHFSNGLYVLASKFHVYQFINDENLPQKSGLFNILEDKLSNFTDNCVHADFIGDITLLYKRKFDNVQEYMERKKLRLETK